MSKDLIPPAFGSQGLGSGLGSGLGVGLGNSSAALSSGFGVGPGSQPVDEDGMELDYMEMPREMATFDPPIAPEPEDTAGMIAGKAKLEELLVALECLQSGWNQRARSISLN